MIAARPVPESSMPYRVVDDDVGIRFRRWETLALALALTASWHAIPSWLLGSYLPARSWYDRWGIEGYSAIRDCIASVMPLLLCFSTPVRSGLVIGQWKGCSIRVLVICLVPIILTAIVYPLTSAPFKGQPHSMWTISPLAQDALFTGYLYGLISERFSGKIRIGLSVPIAVFITAAFFSLWHVPNFQGIGAAYVAFQLIYVFIGGAWTLMARVMTGSMIPGVLVHMAVNFIAWKGW
ncbi:MAG TPA: CPBP family intramembrane glutamic endopeptidase [Phycisphaerae bacterium]|nr:CPBP family intramembrane glutamic endopeptidase [Phycisphaerae bacterium]